MTPCPCQSGQAYSACCGRLHSGVARAESAEALMRSRYSAYVRADVDYLLETWHPDTRPPALDLVEAGKTRWLGLEVKRHAMTGPDRAMVEFVARYKVGGAAAVRQHELSHFVCEHGRWYYYDGEFPGR